MFSIWSYSHCLGLDFLSLLNGSYGLKFASNFSVPLELEAWFVDCSVREENAAGSYTGDRQGVPEEAYLIIRHSLPKKSTPELLQGKELQAYWFSYSKRWVCCGAGEVTKLRGP
ncbi:hypothetical protein SLEP1_g20900 [Rubroshorea leprosula]|uniref:Uncharacterized protein n=1 Tax=Rubroshorea leprosula TaxID=152421 RepID=A0AAV5JAB2_9ROSI|nr:hypothetical protein SLEP1_g20900 [Rubroshorea leprosula]